jgi:hypothetical protein
MTTGADWLDQGRRLLEALVQTAEPSAKDGGDAEHRSECRWCPLCQAAAVVRGERPEVSAALADVLDATAAALRTFAAAAGEAPPPTDDAGQGDGEPAPAVQRIEIA